ncbi:hypothetical protein IU11_12090, partial [Cellulosimicrobium sp. MM]
RQARDWARRTGGAGAAHAMRDYQQAATELALLHDRVERGAVEAWRVEGQRRALLQLMLTGTPGVPRPGPAAAAGPVVAGSAVGVHVRRVGTGTGPAVAGRSPRRGGVRMTSTASTGAPSSAR